MVVATGQLEPFRAFDFNRSLLVPLANTIGLDDSDLVHREFPSNKNFATRTLEQSKQRTIKVTYRCYFGLFQFVEIIMTGSLTYKEGTNDMPF